MSGLVAHDILTADLISGQAFAPATLPRRANRKDTMQPVFVIFALLAAIGLPLWLTMFRSSRWIRSGRSRCRRTGSSARSPVLQSTRTITSGSFIAPAPSSTTRRARWRTRRPPNAASRRRRCSSSTPRETCWRPGAGPKQGYDWPKSEHGISVDRQRQCLARGQPQGGSSDPEILAGRKVPAADRQAGRPRRLQLQYPARQPRPHGGRRRRRASSMWPTAIRTAASSCSMPPPAPTSAIGAPTASSRRPMTSCLHTIRRRRSRRASAIPCIACGCPTMDSCMSAIASMTASRYFARTAPS